MKYFNNRSSIKTKDKFRKSFSFKFEFVSADKILRYINEIDIKKSSSGEISPAIIKLAKKEILIPIANCINKCISTKSFSDELKVVNVIPVFKKEDPNNKGNYQPISLLPIISKIFERVLFEQFEKHSEKILSPKLKRPFYITCPLKSTEKLAKNFRQVWCYRNSSYGPKQGIRLSST